MILYLDTETFNEQPMSAGTHRYAETVEVMVVTWAIDDGPVQTYDRTDFGCSIPAAGAVLPGEVERAIAEGATVVMHNSAFDRTILRHNFAPIRAEQVHDTMVQAMSHGLPGGLDKLCSIFPVPEVQRKHKGGKELIQRFCKPAPKNHKVRRYHGQNSPKEWQVFLEYAGSDIHSMRWLYKNLPRWNYPEREHPLWVLDQKINDRGIKMDLDLARGAIEAIQVVKVGHDARTQELTAGAVRSTSQRDELLQALLFEFGVILPDLTSDTLERRLDDPDLPAEVKELLGIRLMASATSTAKHNRVVKGVSKDGRLRGTLQFCGAPRTKRWAGRVFQPQNLPRPDMAQADIDHAIDVFSRAPDAAPIFLGDEVMRASWNVLRGLIVCEQGRKLVQADLSGIEARVLPWLAGEQWKLQVWRDKDAGTGPDVYKATAARLLGIGADEVTGKQRQSHGKVVELACGYGGGAGAFAQFAAIYRVDMAAHEVDAAVRGWRQAHPAIADWDDGFWAQLDRAARNAILNPGRVFMAGKHIAFERWRNWLKMHLPSGGFLSYAAPAITEDPRRPGKDSVSFMGLDNYTRKWERIFTYGGKLSADATQSTAREILAHNLPWVEENGFPIVLQVHDEVVTEPLDDPNQSVDKLIACLTRRPGWIDDDLPLAAGGFEAYRYKKDD